MSATVARQPRLRRADIETLIRSDGFVVVVQRDEVGCEQMVILERGQLATLAAEAELAYQIEERRQRKTTRRSA